MGVEASKPTAANRKREIEALVGVGAYTDSLVPVTDYVDEQFIDDIRREKQLSLENSGGGIISFSTDEPQYAFGILPLESTEGISDVDGAIADANSNNKDVVKFSSRRRQKNMTQKQKEENDADAAAFAREDVTWDESTWFPVEVCLLWQKI